MRSRRSVRWGEIGPSLPAIAAALLLTACGVAPIGAAAGAVQTPARREAPRTPPPLTPDQIDNISFYTSILMDAATDPGIRARAAIRLRDMRLPQAVTPLAEALRSEPAMQSAVVEAMSTAEPPVPDLLEPGVEALRTAIGPTREMLAMALARYEEPALRLIAEIAHDREAILGERLNCITALGAFRTRSAAIELMSLLDAAERESPEIVDAVCAALNRGTGLPYGPEPDQWRRWWDEARDQPPEEWLTKMVQRLSEQIAASSQQIRRERERVEHAERRVVETYRELFHLVQPEEQMRLLPLLLEDQLASVREFGMDRISRMLRDSVRLSEDVQHKLADRLDDERPALRLQAARLLDQLHYEPAAERFARRLGSETSAEVAAGLLEILARRPSRGALEHVLPWLAERAQMDRAANAVWEIISLGDLTDEHITAARDASREAMGRHASHACARLYARLATDEELAELERLLDSDDPLMRAAVAEGVFRRGTRQPLLDRAGDEQVYPFLVRLIADGPATLANLRLLGSLPPGEAHRQIWRDSVVRLHGNMAPEKLLEADDLIVLWNDAGPASGEPPGHQAGHMSGVSGVRVDTLSRAAALPPDAIPADQRVELLTRLARLLLDRDQPQRAHEVIESANGLATTPALQAVRFEAAALSGQYGVAAQVHADPDPWIALLVATAERNAERAVPLGEEIKRRFENQLNGEHKAELDAVRERLRRHDPRDQPAAS